MAAEVRHFIPTGLSSLNLCLLHTVLGCLTSGVHQRRRWKHFQLAEGMLAAGAQNWKQCQAAREQTAEWLLQPALSWQTWITHHLVPSVMSPQKVLCGSGSQRCRSLAARLVAARLLSPCPLQPSVRRSVWGAMPRVLHRHQAVWRSEF